MLIFSLNSFATKRLMSKMGQVATTAAVLDCQVQMSLSRLLTISPTAHSSFCQNYKNTGIFLNNFAAKKGAKLQILLIVDSRSLF